MLPSNSVAHLWMWAHCLWMCSMRFKYLCHHQAKQKISRDIAWIICQSILNLSKVFKLKPTVRKSAVFFHCHSFLRLLKKAENAGKILGLIQQTFFFSSSYNGKETTFFLKWEIMLFKKVVYSCTASRHQGSLQATVTSRWESSLLKNICRETQFTSAHLPNVDYLYRLFWCAVYYIAQTVFKHKLSILITYNDLGEIF